jgi:integrase
MSSIRQTKAGKFEARVWASGKRYSRTFESFAKAEHWSAGIRCGEIQLSKVSNADIVKESRSNEVTVYQALERYLGEVVTKQKGIVQASNRVKALQCEPFAHKKLTELSIEDVRRLRDRELERGCAGPTVARKLAVLSSMVIHAQQEWGLEIENPARKVRRPALSKPRMTRLEPQDEKLLLEGCDGTSTPYLRQVIELAIETGMRKGELLGLTWQSVDLVRRVITLADTKNGRARFVPLTDRAVEVLRATRESGVSRPVPISQSALDNAWKRVIRRTGLVGLRFHDLRHEALSRWANRLEGDVFKLSLVSGHQTLQMAQRYVHPSIAEVIAKLAPVREPN